MSRTVVDNLMDARSGSEHSNSDGVHIHNTCTFTFITDRQVEKKLRSGVRCSACLFVYEFSISCRSQRSSDRMFVAHRTG